MDTSQFRQNGAEMGSSFENPHFENIGWQNQEKLPPEYKFRIELFCFFMKGEKKNNHIKTKRKNPSKVNEFSVQLIMKLPPKMGSLSKHGD